ncbi:hypothetical protein ACWGK1_24200 [Streptomyces wedmorensis]
MVDALRGVDLEIEIEIEIEQMVQEETGCGGQDDMGKHSDAGRPSDV